MDNRLFRENPYLVGRLNRNWHFDYAQSFNFVSKDKLFNTFVKQLHT